MSRTISPSANRPYGLARVARTWKIARSTIYAQLSAERARVNCAEMQGAADRDTPKRGPKTQYSDADLVACIRAVLSESQFVGEGHRKVWAKLRFQGVRTSRVRVLRLMRENELLAPTRAPRVRGPYPHDGTITTEQPNEMWGTDATTVMTGEGTATVFIAIDHCSSDCVGIHAARVGTRFEALDVIAQGVREHFGGYDAGIALGLKLRHDYGSQFVSHHYQEEIRFLGIESSPSFIRMPEGNGCSERFIRTLNEQLLWIRFFATVEELLEALHEFKDRYNQHWLVARHGFRSPAAVRAEHQAQLSIAA
jgi:putative transposase